MRKGIVVTILLIALLFHLISTSSAVFASSENWVGVARFTQDGDNYPTEPFTIDYAEWRIVWEFDPGHWHFHDLHTLQVTTYKEGESTNYFNQIREPPNGNLNGVELLIQSGTFYMEINSALIDSYTIIVEQNIDSIPEFPSWIIVPFIMIMTLIVIRLRKKLSKKD